MCICIPRRDVLAFFFVAFVLLVLGETPGPGLQGGSSRGSAGTGRISTRGFRALGFEGF